MRRDVAWGLLMVSACWCSGVAAVPDLAFSITDTSIEDLLNIKITSVSKKTEQVSHAPAAVYVLTAEDIHRSGVTSIPEALRLVPGVQVARIDANKWAVSIRGFNSRSANKLLVLIDGRSVYEPLFTGVLWESKDVMLEDVDRIEVIRGPGGTLWGANAVNGVINVITKSAGDTQGGLLAATGGDEERGAVSVRYGLSLSDGHDMRFYAKSLKRDAGFLQAREPDDESQFSQFGFRYDGKLAENDTVTVQGDAYDGEQGPVDSLLVDDSSMSGHNLLSRWSRSLDNGSLSLLFYYDHTDIDFPQTLAEERDTYSLELEHQFSGGDSHQIVWGVNYRRTSDQLDNRLLLALQPDSRNDSLSGIYLQDEITLKPDSLYLTLGAKVESYEHADNAVLPNIRLAWQVSDSDILWFAASKAVRAPSRLEQDVLVELPVPLAAPATVTLVGNRALESEELTAYEIGYRFAVTQELYIDLAAFVNRYDKLVTVEIPELDPLAVPEEPVVVYGNRMSGDTNGVELVATYFPSERWKWVLGYSRLDMDLQLDTDSVADPATPESIEENNPQQQAFLRVGVGPFDSTTIDLTVRYVDELPLQAVDSYTVADLRIARRFGEYLEIALVAQNMLDDPHFEQRAGQVTQVEQGTYVKMRYAF